MFSYLIQGIAYGFAAAVTPGPLSMYLISQTLRHGWRRALPVAFAPIVSDGPIAVLIVTLLSRVPAEMVLYLRIAGGIFILYLALGTWRAYRSFHAETPIGGASRSIPLFKAAMINWLNPNPYIGWSLILGPILLSGWRESPSFGIAYLAGFYIIMIVTMIGMIALFAAAGTIGFRMRKSLIGLSSIALAFFGAYQLWMGGSMLLAH
jgi:threonine/homoserine/homoserine lactone efflux protein